MRNSSSVCLTLRIITVGIFLKDIVGLFCWCLRVFSSMYGTWFGVLGWAENALLFCPFKIMGTTVPLSDFSLLITGVKCSYWSTKGKSIWCGWRCFLSRLDLLTTKSHACSRRSVHNVTTYRLILDIPMCYSNSKNKTISTSNTSMFIVDRSRQHVSTLIGSSSGLLFGTSL